VGCLLWQEVGSVVFSFCWAPPVQPFSGPSLTGLMSIFYCFYFWNSPNICICIYFSLEQGGPVIPLGTGFTDFLKQPTVSCPDWCWDPIWSLWSDFFYCLTTAGFLVWGALSDERMGLKFSCTTGFGPCQSSHSRVRVTQNSRPYFTVSFETTPTWKSRSLYLYPPGRGWPSHTHRHWVPFLSPLTTRRAMMDIF
jgi:hypothetical protein